MSYKTNSPFKFSLHNNTCVIQPHTDIHLIPYRDLQTESNLIRMELSKRKVRGVVIDLEGISYTGSELIGVFVSILRETKSRAGIGCFCNVSQNFIEVLSSMGLLRIWKCFPTLEEAIEHVQGPVQKVKV